MKKRDYSMAEQMAEQLIEQNDDIVDIKEDNKIDIFSVYPIYINNSKNTNNDYTVFDAYNAGLFTPIKEILLPKDFTIKEYNSLSIHKQKDKDNSCVGYAIADMVYYLYLTKLDYRGEGLSARFIWIASKETDEIKSHPTSFIQQAGTTLKAGLSICKKYGCVPNSIFPSEDDTLYKGTVEQFYAFASQYKISSYFNLKVDTPSRQILIWKMWLTQNSSIVVRVNIDKNWINYKGEKLEYYNQYGLKRKHAVLIVGYNEDGFIIRNSWDKDWGDNGYATVSYSYAVDAFDESYGAILITNETAVGIPLPPTEPKSFWDIIFS